MDEIKNIKAEGRKNGETRQKRYDQFHKKFLSVVNLSRICTTYSCG